MRTDGCAKNGKPERRLGLDGRGAGSALPAGAASDTRDTGFVGLMKRFLDPIPFLLSAGARSGIVPLG